ncbi:MAG: hypothetical protein WB795_07865, partial [Candidatus Acidiferrales bacterium]
MSVLLLLFPHAASASGAPSGAPPPVIEMANGLAADQAGGPVLSLPQYVSELDRWTHAIENAPEDAAALKALRKT